MHSTAPLPTAHRQCGKALQKLQKTQPAGSVAVHYNSSTAQCTWALSWCILVVSPPWPPRSVAVHCRNSNTHCPPATWECIARAALPIAPRRCGSALHKFHCPLHKGSVKLHCRSFIAQCPQALWQCIAAVPMPTAPRQCGNALQEMHSTLHTCRVVVHCEEFHCPLPAGAVALYYRSSTARYPQAVWRCMGQIPRPTAPK